MAALASDPQEVFENPPQSAKTGVWWHWMGCNVSKEGIVRDLDWFKETGIGAATIFGMADACTPGNPRDVTQAAIEEIYRSIY